MKAFLWTMFVIYLLAFVNEVTKKPGHTRTETHKSLLFGALFSAFMAGWSGYLLWSTP